MLRTLFQTLNCCDLFVVHNAICCQPSMILRQHAGVDVYIVMIYVIVLLILVVLGEFLLVRKGMKAAAKFSTSQRGTTVAAPSPHASPNKKSSRHVVESSSASPSETPKLAALTPSERYPNVVEFPGKTKEKAPADFYQDIRGKTPSQPAQEKSMLEIIQEIRGKNIAEELNMENADSNNGNGTDAVPQYETFAELEQEENIEDADTNGMAQAYDVGEEEAEEPGIEDAEEIVETENGASADELLKAGIRCVKQGRLEDGVASLEQAVDAAPNRAETYFNLGIAYTLQERIAQATDAYQRAIELDPNYGKAYFNLGTLYLKQGKIDLAIAKLEQAVELLTDPMKALWNLYEAYRSKELFSKALFTLKQLIELEPDDASLHNHVGICYVKLGDYVKAISSWQQAIELGATSQLIYYNLGKTYELCGQFLEATEQYNIFLERQGNEPEWQELVDEVQERLKNIQAHS